MLRSGRGALVLASLLMVAAAAVVNLTGSASADFGSYRDRVLADAPVGYWRLGEAGGLTAANEVSGPAGTYVAGVTPGRPGALVADPDTAVRLDGTSGYVRVADSPTLAVGDALTIEAWVRRAAGKTTPAIVSKGANWATLRWLKNGRLTFEKAGVGAITTSTVAVNDTTTWHHVVATKQGSAVKLYIDGVDRTGSVTNRTITDTTAPLDIGRLPDGTGYFGGLVDEVAVYNRALSAERVKVHYRRALDAAAPIPTLTAPASGSSTSDTTPAVSGAAGTAAGDSTTVTVRVYAGESVSGTPVRTLTTTRGADGAYAVEAAPPLPAGTYTAQAEQADDAENLGRSDPATFTIDLTDTTAPLVTLVEPAPGASTEDMTPTFSGTAGTEPGDSTTVTVPVYAGSSASGTPVQTLSTTRGANGSYTVEATTPLAAGTYTAQAEQSDDHSNVGLSSANTFTVTAPSGATSYRDAVLADAPVSYWRLGETSGIQAVDVLNRNSGTYTGGVTLGRTGAIAGDTDTAVSLNGTTGFVSTPSSSTLNLADGPLSLEAWVQRGAANRTDVIIHKGTGTYQLRWTNTNRLALLKANVAAVATSTTTVTDSSWHHVVATKQGGTVKLYIDGVDRTGTVTIQTLSDATTSTLRIGTDSSSYLSGHLDEVAIYNSVLSPARVQAHFDAGRARPATEALTLSLPAPGASTSDTTPSFHGTAGTAAGDATTVTVHVYSGASATGTPVQELTTTRADNGAYAVEAAAPLALGTYTAQAEQLDGAGTAHLSNANTFTITATDPVLLAAGDIASCAASDGDMLTAALLDGEPTATVATMGDNVYPTATLSEYEQCYGASWGRAKNRTRPGVGGHDYEQPGAAGYFAYFGAAAGDPAKGYYSFDLGAWHVVVLNSCEGTTFGCGEGSEQEQWLRADLAAHPNACTLAYWHRPRFSSGKVHGSLTAMQPFWQALYDYGADVVLNGHEHVYERFAPQTPGGALDAQYGVRQFTVGTGGYYLYDFAQPIANSEVRINNTYGVIKLTLRPTGYDWQFLPVAGGTATDTGSGACHE